MSHWSSGLGVCFPSQGTQGQIPRGVLMWNWDSPVSVVSLYIGDPDVIDHHCGLVPNQHYALVPKMWYSHLISHSFPVPVSRSLQVSLPASQPMESAAGGCPMESLQSHFILPMSHWSSGLPVCFPSQGTQVQIPKGVFMWNRDSPVSVVSLQFRLFISVFGLFTIL